MNFLSGLVHHIVTVYLHSVTLARVMSQTIDLRIYRLADNTALAAVISLAQRKISLAQQSVLRTATAYRQTARIRRAC